MTNKKRILLTAAIIVPMVVFAALAIAAYLTEFFALQAALHIYRRLGFTIIALIILRRFLQEQLGQNLYKAMVICSVSILADLVIAEGIRYVLSGGTSAILFLPACLPISLMAIVHYSAKFTGVEKKEWKTASFAIGIPLLLLALFFEVLSFM